jgi:hypothetical protein
LPPFFLVAGSSPSKQDDYIPDPEKSNSLKAEAAQFRIQLAFLFRFPLSSGLRNILPVERFIYEGAPSVSDRPLQK